MTDLYIMAVALFVFWITSDKEALILMTLWSISIFLFVESPSWFAFYAMACAAGCVLSKVPLIIYLYILQSMIVLGCLIEWYAGGNFLFEWYNYMIGVCFVVQLAGVTFGNYHCRLSGDILSRNLSFTITRG